LGAFFYGPPRRSAFPPPGRWGGGGGNLFSGAVGDWDNFFFRGQSVGSFSSFSFFFLCLIFHPSVPNPKRSAWLVFHINRGPNPFCFFFFFVGPEIILGLPKNNRGEPATPGKKKKYPHPRPRGRSLAETCKKTKQKPCPILCTPGIRGFLVTLLTCVATHIFPNFPPPTRSGKYKRHFFCVFFFFLTRGVFFSTKTRVYPKIPWEKIFFPDN